MLPWCHLKDLPTADVGQPKNQTGFRRFIVKPAWFKVVFLVLARSAARWLRGPCRTESENKMTQHFFALGAFLIVGRSLIGYPFLRSPFLDVCELPKQERTF